MRRARDESDKLIDVRILTPARRWRLVDRVRNMAEAVRLQLQTDGVTAVFRRGKGESRTGRRVGGWTREQYVRSRRTLKRHK